MNQEHEMAHQAMNPRQSSHRIFGQVMAGAFLFLTLASAWKNRGWPSPFYPALSFLFFVFATHMPFALAPLNAVWSLLGRVLHRVMSPLILGAMYFFIFTPFGFFFRLAKKDPLRLRIDREATTYWIRREKQPGEGMENQF